MRRRAFRISAGLAMVIPMDWALAQQAPPEEAQVGISEVVVTAQRLEENLQRAALSVTAVGGDVIAQHSITNVSDLTQLVPALTATPGVGPYTNLSVRGVSSTVANSFGDPAIAVNVDQVFLARTTSSRGLFYDLERVEVLKGPQGTLYGRNATGGAINVITHGPVLGEFGGSLTLEAGNKSLRNITGVLNAPLGQNAAVRGAFQTVDRDGYMSDGSDDEKRRSGRLSFAYLPSDSFRVTVRGDYTHEGGIGNGGTAINADGSFYGNPRTSIVDQSAALTPIYAARCPTFLPTAPPCKPLPPNAFQDNNYYGVSADTEWDVSAGTFTFIPAYRHDGYDFLGEPTGFIIREDNSARQSSFEARFASNRDHALRYIVGAYYLDTAQTGLANYDQQSNGTSSVQDIHVSGYSYAGFGQLTWAVSDVFRATAGVRYTFEEKKTNSRLDITPFFQPLIDPIPALGAPEALTNATKDFNATNWKAGVEWDVTPTSFLYANVGTGFKSGGFFFNVPGDPQGNTYKPENVTAYTIGSKNRFLENRVQLNAEVFQLNYKDQQIATLGVNASGLVIFPQQNAGQSTIRGAELDAQFLPMDSTLIGLNVQYVHARYDEFVYRSALSVNPVAAQAGTACKLGLPGTPTLNPALAVYAVDCSGMPAQQTPEWIVNAGVQQTFSLGSGAKMVADLNSRYSDRRATAIQYLPYTLVGSYTRTNLSLTYHSPQDGWSLGAYVNNIEDKDVASVASRSVGHVGFLYADMLSPRTYGLRLGVRF
jgi:iron complex outermembrane receptor protein